VKVKNGWEIAGAVIGLAALGMILHNASASQTLGSLGVRGSVGILQVAEGMQPTVLTGVR